MEQTVKKKIGVRDIMTIAAMMGRVKIFSHFSLQALA